MSEQLPYKPGTPMNTIIEDGWSRGFLYSQTLDELRKMGYNLSLLELVRCWDALEADERQYYDNLKIR